MTVQELSLPALSANFIGDFTSSRGVAVGMARKCCCAVAADWPEGGVPRGWHAGPRWFCGLEAVGSAGRAAMRSVTHAAAGVPVYCTAGPGVTGAAGFGSAAACSVQSRTVRLLQDALLLVTHCDTAQTQRRWRDVRGVW